jgi:hypothetical protein
MIDHDERADNHRTLNGIQVSISIRETHLSNFEDNVNSRHDAMDMELEKLNHRFD